jgi:hypothetical protein
MTKKARCSGGTIQRALCEIYGPAAFVALVSLIELVRKYFLLGTALRAFADK